MGNEAGLLEQISIASPCTADWASMTGDARVRFCGQCRLNVYNLSGMSREESEALVRASEGKLCVRLFRREDGTVLTSDCPVGVRAVRALRRTIGAAAAGLAAFLGVGAWLASNRGGAVMGAPVRVAPEHEVMGKMACPRPSPSPASPTNDGSPSGE